MHPLALETQKQRLDQRFLKQKQRVQMPWQAYRCCFCFKRMFKLKMAEPPNDIEELFNKYSDSGLMTAKMLQRFLVEVQGEGKTTIDDAQKIVDTVLKHLPFSPKGLDLDAFFKYLFGDLNPPFPPLGVHHDMKAPLAHYFMYTGHNSYLPGNQFSSRSSIQPIIKALRRGVRVIELDLWPNAKKDDVLVLHGRTLTSSVKLIKCLKAIKDNAFHASKYPVIITFEDHLDSSLQGKVAEMLKSTFGEMLEPATEYLQFPSPESFKEKILISTKPPEKNESTSEKTKECNCLPIRSLSGSKTKDEHHMHITPSQMEEEEAEAEAEEETPIPKYDDSISIRAIKMEKGGLKSVLEDDSKRVARLSLSEQTLENAVKTLGTDIVRFTQRNLLRVYPRGSRLLSSNYNSLTAWTHGAQMVAFNMQGYGKHLWIMQGLFRANGSCGYVKKPDILLKAGREVFDPSSVRAVKAKLKVKVYMGDGWALDFTRTHFDPFSPPDFFTRLEIYGVPADKQKTKTGTLTNQWVPMWNKEFEFQLTVPELAVLRIEVCEFDIARAHDFGGQTCLPVSELRSGIRAVPLYDKRGKKYKHVKLLMRFDIIEYY